MNKLDGANNVYIVGCLILWVVIIGATILGRL